MGYTVRIQKKSDLRAYILRKLGSPVINIELTEDQLDDAIDDTIEQYMRIAYAGMVERYIPITIKKDVRSYIMPNEVFAILDCHSAELGGIANNAPSQIFSLNQYVAADLYRGSGKIDLLTYEMTNQMLGSLEILFTRKITFDYNCISRELYLFEIPPADDNVMLHVYKKNIPISSPNPLYGNVADEPEENEVTNIYNEIWIRNMAWRKAQYQWAMNLTKYNGSQLPNGLVLDVPTILAEAKEYMLKHDEELELTYQLPCDFYCA